MSTDWDKLSYEDFKKRINEQAIYVSDLSRFDNYLTHVNDEKLILKDLKDEMSKLKEMISHFNHHHIFDMKLKKDYPHYLYRLKYNDDIEIIIKSLKRLLRNIEKGRILEKANLIVYGAEYEMNFHFDIQIDIKNFNRIHLIDELPYSLRDLGLGKILYKNIIEKIGWLSSNFDANVNSKFVWDSLSKDQELYTCLKDKSIICFNWELDFNIIENILRKWIKDSKDYVIDSDLMKKYPDLDIK